MLILSNAAIAQKGKRRVKDGRRRRRRRVILRSRVAPPSGKQPKTVDLNAVTFIYLSFTPKTKAMTFAGEKSKTKKLVRSKQVSRLMS